MNMKTTQELPAWQPPTQNDDVELPPGWSHGYDQDQIVEEVHRHESQYDSKRSRMVTRNF